MKNNVLKILSIVIVCLLFILAGIGIGVKIESSKNPSQAGSDPVQKDGQVKNAPIDVNALKETFKEENEYSKNVEIIKYFYYENPSLKDYGTGKELQVYGKNNNNVAVEINAELNFYDEKGNIIDYKSDRINVLPNTEFGLSILAYSSKDYYGYSIRYEINKSKSYYIFLDNVKTTSINKTENDSINISYKNESEKTVDMIRYTCILYQGQEVIGVLKAYASSVNPGASAVTTCYNGTEIKYSDYKVILSESYNYTEESEKWDK